MTHLAAHHPTEIPRSRKLMQMKNLELTDPKTYSLCLFLNRFTSRGSVGPEVVVIP